VEYSDKLPEVQYERKVEHASKTCDNHPLRLLVEAVKGATDATVLPCRLASS